MMLAPEWANDFYYKKGEVEAAPKWQAWMGQALIGHGVNDVALEKSRDEATDARPRLVVGIRVTGHGHTKRCVQAGTVGRERRVLRWYGFVDC